MNHTATTMRECETRPVLRRVGRGLTRWSPPPFVFVTETETSATTVTTFCTANATLHFGRTFIGHKSHHTEAHAAS